jgi:hypothetical protein
MFGITRNALNQQFLDLPGNIELKLSSQSTEPRSASLSVSLWSVPDTLIMDLLLEFHSNWTVWDLDKAQA